MLPKPCGVSCNHPRRLLIVYCLQAGLQAMLQPTKHTSFTSQTGFSSQPLKRLICFASPTYTTHLLWHTGGHQTFFCPCVNWLASLYKPRF